MPWKTLAAVALAGSLTVALTGCDDNANPSDAAQDTTQQDGQSLIDKGKEGIEKGKEKLDQAKQDATAKAQGMIDQVNGYLSEGKIAEAKELIQKLQGMKSELPENLQKQIDTLADKVKNMDVSGVRNQLGM